MKKILMCLSLMMCMMTSCQKDEDVNEEPKPEPEKPVIKYAEGITGSVLLIIFVRKFGHPG